MGETLFEGNSKVALIDADTVVYAVASVKEYPEDLLSQDFYSDEEWEKLISEPTYDEQEHCIWRIDIEEATQMCVDKIEYIKERADCSTAELYFTSGKNFRYAVDPMYKANRKNSRYPVGMMALKKELLSRYPGEICTEIEADDAVVYLKRTQPDKYVLCAVDKDVYKSVAGDHFNYYTSAKYKIPMKWVETTKEDAEAFPYLQTLMGDSTDNIRGCPGIGPKKAEKALAKCKTSLERWEIVVKLFEQKKLTVKDAIRDMRLVNMHQVTKDKETKWVVNFWIPPTV